ncbi:MAG: Spy/CpxP family protein refolding chaperone [Desulfarculaceae bacterium]|nr:Spy/CpxP family protein refolding chaperone [Desulfarculaceae bacterium]MCF8047401.1 Spy/CpxP family protein refolding chaperone [Desulfarculaceae bacterium]MCF8066796.1 Spy/CpxP family protein refolding chaperone [Desulfarculaceae bacterium]MCF8096663.1 Spy/CpxP family protein refolding chaperone [Desulfarculaceae bacterium]
MSRKFLMVCMVALSLVLAAGMAFAQMGNRGMMQPNQMPQQGQPQQPGYGPGMMGPGYGGGYGPGMMMGGGGYGGGMGMMGMGGYGGGFGGGMGSGGGMMGMMMGHMMGGGFGGGMGMMGGGMMGMGRMLPYLNLSPQQWEKVRGLAYQRLEKMAQLRSKLFQQRLELLNLAGQGKVDAAKVKKLFVQQAELKADLFLAGLDYLQQVEKVLTPEQKKQLKGWGLR